MEVPYSHHETIGFVYPLNGEPNMYRSLITAVSLLTLASAPAFAATSASTPPKATHAMSKVAPVKPAEKHRIASRNLKTHRTAKTAGRHTSNSKMSAKAMPSKKRPAKSSS
jgi:hypothetical protein